MLTTIEDRTTYTFLDIDGEVSRLTLHKDVADWLQSHVKDVHSWVQNQYNRIVEGQHSFAESVIGTRRKKKLLSRRAIGDMIRAYSFSLYIDELEDF